MLTIKNLSAGYGNTKIIENISFSVKEGEICGIFGPNGAGKSTLLKCIVGFINPISGDILVNNESILKYPPEKKAKIISYVPQEHKPPFPYLAKEVVLMGRTPHISSIFGPKKEDMIKALNAMKTLNIEHLSDKPYTDLSGGQRQLVLLARALAQETKIMVLDEPTSALDFKNQILIFNILKKLSKKGYTILVCVHDPNYILWFCDKVAVINNGKLLDFGNPKKVLNKDILKRLYGNLCKIENNIVVPNLKIIN
ncbi:ABC transporter ATP-binding protein [Methanocaldococcus indicus]|uniref:ABC transporter ATP-binding protein n=1 Tax=Methanocaldococcus indicus TaxID=213231 RepID=UPI003C6CD563